MNKNSGNLILRSLLFNSLAVSGILILECDRSLAQVIPDNTLGNENSVVNPRDATSDSIEGGARRGQNLFHSFQEFNVDAGRGIYFANPDAVTNIFSRVTGNNVSNILGTLGVDGAADLYLINPNGIVFGEDASLDVRGSFAATTASGIEFGENGLFSVNNPDASQLLRINPSAYLFNQIENQFINSIESKGLLGVTSGKSLFFLGGDIRLNNSFINAPEGLIELGGLAETGKIKIDNDGELIFISELNKANITLTNNSNIVANFGGSISINAKNLEIIEDSRLLAGVGADSDNLLSSGGDVSINASNTVFLNNSSISNLVNSEASVNSGNININSNYFEGINATVETINRGQGNGGEVFIQTDESIALYNSGIVTVSNVAGNSGNVNLQAEENISLNSTTIGTASFGIGNAGDIKLLGKSISITDNSVIDAASFEKGSAGLINIEGAFISVNNTNVQARLLGEGKSGNIDIKSDSLLTVDTASLDTSSLGQGDAGNINIQTDSLIISNGSEIFAESLVNGNSGDININSTGMISVDEISTEGLASRISTDVADVTDNKADNNGGSINIISGSFSLENDAQISSVNFGQGNTGDINIKSNNAISISQGASISNSATRNNIQNSGNINIEAKDFFLSDTAELISTTEELGNANNIVITAEDTVSITGGSSLGSLTRGQGNSGDINIRTKNFFLSNLAVLTASTFGEGNAGNISIEATDSILINGGSSITTFTRGQGNAGDIDIQSGKAFVFDGMSNAELPSIIETSVAGLPDFSGSRNSGNINIEANSFSASNGALLIATTLEKGNAGNITIKTTESVIFDESSGAFSNIGTNAIGSGGIISIETGALTLSNGAQLQSQVRGKGNAGAVKVQARDSILFDGVGKEGISSGVVSQVERNAVGNGGEINIDAKNFSIKNGAQLQALTLGEGNAGDININVSDFVSIDGVSNEGRVSKATSEVDIGAQGMGGNINLVTNFLSITNGASLTTSTVGGGNGGDINIESGNLLLFNDGLINSSSGLDDAGNININVLETLRAFNSDIDTSSIASSGGSIKINATNIYLKIDSNIKSFVLDSSGGGGDINMTADAIVAFDDSDILAFSQDGRGGDITLNTPAFFAENFTLNSLNENSNNSFSILDLENNDRADLNATGAVSGAVEIPDVSFIQNSLNDLPDNSISINELVANSCVAPVSGRQQGNFIITGVDSLPVRPGNADISNFSTGEVRNVPENNNNSWQRGEPIVEPQGVYRLNNGKLVLSRECN